MIYSGVLTAMKNTDRSLLEMAALFKVPFGRRLRMIHLPHLAPYLLSACGVAAGMTWKAGVAAEVIGMVPGSVGEKLYNAKIYFENADLLAWTLIIILLSAAMEKAFVFLLGKVIRGVVKR